MFVLVWCKVSCSIERVLNSGLIVFTWMYHMISYWIYIYTDLEFVGQIFREMCCTQVLSFCVRACLCRVEQVMAKQTI